MSTHTDILVMGQLLLSAHTHTYTHTHTHTHISNGTVTDICKHTHIHTNAC